MNRITFRERLMPQGSIRRRVFVSLRSPHGFLLVLQRGIEIALRKAIHLAQRVRWWFGDVDSSAAFTKPAAPIRAGPSVVCLPIINWDYRFQRPQQLLTQFARDGYRVFYLRATFAGFRSPAAGMRALSDGIYELDLPGDTTLALYRDVLRDPTLRWSVRALRAFIESNDLQRALCLVHHPFWLSLAQWLKQEYGWKIVYDCLDDLTGFEVASPSIATAERNLARSSDLVMATSRFLFKRMGELNQNCILLPNAADYDHFSRLPSRDASPLSGLPRPVVGYYGAIAEWFDVAAISLAAERHLEWSFVLIGRTWGADLRLLAGCHNVHLLGEKPYSDLPAYVAGFDLCTIPFLDLPLTQSTNPVKMFEYLSTGKPIVARALPELQPFENAVELYSASGEFTGQVEHALATDAPELHDQRRALARENTWEKRYEDIKARLAALSS